MTTRLALTARRVARLIAVGLVVAMVWPTRAAELTVEQRIEALIDQGIEQRRAHDIKGSIATLGRALVQARANKLTKLEWDALGFLALSWREWPDLRRVLALRLEALALVRAHPNGVGPYPTDDEPEALEAVAGAYYLLSDLPNAVRYAQLALDKQLRHRTPLDEVGVGRSRHFLAQLLALSGEGSQAEKLLRQALADFDKRFAVDAPNRTVATAELGFQLGALRSLQGVLVASGRSDEALEIAEASRQRSLAVTNKVPLPALDAGRLSVSQMKTLARRYETTFVIYALAYEFDPDLLLEFSEFTDIPAAAIRIWVLRPDGTSAFREVGLVGADRNIAELVRDARFSIGARGRGVSRSLDPAASTAVADARYPALQALHKLLVAPVRGLLPSAEDSRLMIVPQDLLYLVPFAALQDAAGQYLVDRHAVFVNPSVGALTHQAELLRGSAREGHGVLVVGNPRMPSVPAAPGHPSTVLAALPQAEKEAKDIAAMFGAQPLTGENATKRAVLERMSSARLIHLATHGLMERDKELAQYFNAIALAPTPDDMGFLAARDIDALHLRAELVVLSACDSADGKPTGDNVLGFSSAFFAAGVPSLILTQWSIPDAPTALLMREFYSGLMRGLDKARALRQAMLATMKTHPRPGDWAGFVLVGEPTVAPALAEVKGESAATAGAELPEILLPVPVAFYTESSSADRSNRTATFMTPMATRDVLNYYRQAYGRKGLKEDVQLTRMEARTASLVLGAPGRYRVHVSVVEFVAIGGQPARRSVSLIIEATP